MSNSFKRPSALPGSGHLVNDLGGLMESLSLAQRSNLVELDQALNLHWSLGRNLVLAWSAYEHGVLLLVVPHYAVASYALGHAREDELADSLSDDSFILSLLSNEPQLTQRQLRQAARLLEAEPVYVRLRQPISEERYETTVVDRLVRRYGVNYLNGTAVALFDIVGFSLLTPFEQVSQLNSLSYSINSAHSKMLDRGVSVDFATSGTGDGFYIWNRDQGDTANVNLYHLMHLVLADNAIARSKAAGRTVPLLRTCFHVGSCYEFHHAQGLNPSIHSDIVGDVTIELARMIDRALPGQVFVGEFGGQEAAAGVQQSNSVQFVDDAQNTLSQLSGLELSGEAIESIKCYLTGRPQPDGSFSIRRLRIDDKHGMSRNVFNAKINIYRSEAEPIFLGIEDKVLRGHEFGNISMEHLSGPAAH